MRRIAIKLFRSSNQPNIELLIVAAVIVFVLVIGLNELVRGVSYPSMLGCGLLGLLLAWALFSETRKLMLQILVIILYGVFFSVILSSDVGSVLLSWIWNFFRVIPILLGEMPQEGINQILFATLRVTFTLELLLREIGAWWQNLMSGRGGYNELAILLLWNFVVWALAGWLGWAVRRAKRPFAVIVPIMGVMTLVVAYIKAKTWVLSMVMVVCFILVVFIQHYLREQDWTKRSISYSEEIRLDILVITMAISFLLVILTMIVPSFSFREMVNAFRDLTQSDDSATIAPAIGLYETKKDQFGSSQNSGVLPASQLIGDPPELRQNVVMHVQSSQSFGNSVTDHPYWRSHTYETYTGRGWLVGEVHLNQLNPWEELHLPANMNDTQYQFTFSVYDNAEKRLYYTGQIITTSRPYGVLYRKPLNGTQFGDLFAGLMEHQSYQAMVTWPSYSAQKLSSSSQEYPGWIEERYLQLPSNLPLRLYDLAEQITRDARDPYAKAVAIESYLRNYPYTLLVSPPPEDQDVVDYFLFDAQKGYCDYFSTSMVVLSRAVGLPARLVVGYSTGKYDHDQAFYEVTQADAHSWVEVYFSENGWVEFEPTSGRLMVDRISEIAAESVPERDFSFPVRSSFLWRKIGDGLIYSSIGIFLILGGAIGVDFYILNRKTVKQVSLIFYRRLIWFARKSKIPYRTSLTPFEFAEYYIRCIRDLWRESQIAVNFIERGKKRIDYLTKICVLAAYSKNALDEVESRDLFTDWIMLVPFLLVSWVRTRFKKPEFAEI